MEALRKNRLTRGIIFSFAGLLVLAAICGVVLSAAEGTSHLTAVIYQKFGY